MLDDEDDHTWFLPPASTDGNRGRAAVFAPTTHDTAGAAATAIARVKSGSIKAGGAKLETELAFISLGAKNSPVSASVGPAGPASLATRPQAQYAENHDKDSIVPRSMGASQSSSAAAAPSSAAQRAVPSHPEPRPGVERAAAPAQSRSFASFLGFDTAGALSDEDSLRNEDPRSAYDDVDYFWERRSGRMGVPALPAANERDVGESFGSLGRAAPAKQAATAFTNRVLVPEPDVPARQRRPLGMHSEFQAASQLSQRSQLSQPSQPSQLSNDETSQFSSTSRSGRYEPAPVAATSTQLPLSASVAGLVPVTSIPPSYRTVFSSFAHFNRVQSVCFDTLVSTDSPVVVCAPTGAGKTALFELAILRLLMQRPQRDFKAVYMAPIKALCSERFEDWKSKFEPHGCRCLELTGDSDVEDFRAMADVQIVLTTPEKWDSMTRKWRDNRAFTQSIALFMIDEVHVLNDHARGATLEAVVSRMKTVQQFQRSHAKSALSESAAMRIMALSATIPNADDVASWIGSRMNPAKLYQFDDSFRPVKLDVHVIAYPDAANEFKFDMNLNYRLLEVITTYSAGKPSLVFCATRKGSQQAAEKVLAMIGDGRSSLVTSSDQLQRLQAASKGFKDRSLKECLAVGIGFHHAGLDPSDRRNVESLFASGVLPVLCATTTLAMGVNLPAHLVVVKSTQHYGADGMEEYNEPQVLQMIGRAGRPQFDTTATAVIMTRHATKRKYESLLSGREPIESNLHRHLIEHLNAEIVLQTISDVSIALDWLKSTFFFVRVKKNPTHYGLQAGMPDRQLESALQSMCLQHLKQLADCRLITMDEDGFGLLPTHAGTLMARYCVLFKTMHMFITQAKPESTLEHLIELLAASAEYEDIRLRMAERKILNDLNKSNATSIRFPLDGKIKTRESKINCLVQATLGNTAIGDFSLAQDRERVFKAAIRIGRCVAEFLGQQDGFLAALNAAILSKCLRVRLWENSPYVSRQLEKIGERMSLLLAQGGFNSFEAITRARPMELELLLARHPPFGRVIREAVQQLPVYKLDVVQEGAIEQATATIRVSLSLANAEHARASPSTRVQWFSCLIGQQSTNKVLLRHKSSDAILLSSGNLWTTTIQAQRQGDTETIACFLLSEIYVGLDVGIEFQPKFSTSTFGVPANKQRGDGNTKPGSSTKASAKPAKQPTNAQASSAHAVGDKHSLEPSEAAATATAAAPQCAHTCADKLACGHKCCKGTKSTRGSSKRRADPDEPLEGVKKAARAAPDQIEGTPSRTSSSTSGNGSAATSKGAHSNAPPSSLTALREKSSAIPSNGVKRLRASVPATSSTQVPPQVANLANPSSTRSSSSTRLMAAKEEDEFDSQLDPMDDAIFERAAAAAEPFPDVKTFAYTKKPTRSIASVVPTAAVQAPISAKAQLASAPSMASRVPIGTKPVAAAKPLPSAAHQPLPSAAHQPLPSAAQQRYPSQVGANGNAQLEQASMTGSSQPSTQPSMASVGAWPNMDPQQFMLMMMQAQAFQQQQAQASMFPSQSVAYADPRQNFGQGMIAPPPRMLQPQASMGYDDNYMDELLRTAYASRPANPTLTQPMRAQVAATFEDASTYRSVSQTPSHTRAFDEDPSDIFAGYL
ncbi:DEAD/DEAH box helicase [Capsaspora owczarzaki ATCC 30864]|uniref:DNA 3'-5' helicase n=1 Tax=Capsaspora owczarzaki (strain ATCC 30864) TaxID=595528 RepID=A0A0D2X1A5_CAPO3|nr:DEAD/DEAH box helicase [Capsaspora owczarzaki ATCC 30864]KJE90469.1 DEAD/DEAH box helicase [Capsaspora owczarzaki ATCC 30864]|eukprot:XP_004364647.1 DEAD/DEAH box helicase [Capsaspora owczarzaki ATCC 30864]